jgi:signal transduction histidine kinase
MLGGFCPLTTPRAPIPRGSPRSPAQSLKIDRRTAENVGMAPRPSSTMLLVAAAAMAVTLVVNLTPSIDIAYHSPSLHLVIETTAVLIASMAALLTLGRYRQSGSAADLLLATGLLVLACTNLLFTAPALVLGGTSPELSVWAPMAMRVVGTGLIAASAFAPTTALAPGARRRAPVLAVVGCVISFALIGAAAALLEGRLPVGIDRDAPPPTISGPVFAGHPALLLGQGFTAVLFGIAAVGFARRSRARDEGLFLWLGPAAVLAAVARVNYLLFPSIYTDWVYVGDAFRLGFYACLLAGEVQEIRLYWRRETAAAALDERRRLARDLHDGLAQELAFIVREASGTLPREQLGAAAERALDESRRAIVSLSALPDEPLPVALRTAGDDVARRAGGAVVYAIDPEANASAATRETLIRIMREAITNAIRHGGVERVTVRLEREGVLHLAVSDEGCGFDPEHAGGSGYGLTSMRERAEAAGGTLAIRSRIGRGTTVEVALP